MIFLCVGTAAVLATFAAYLVFNYHKKKIEVREEFEDIMYQIRNIRTRREFIEAEDAVGWFRFYASTVEHKNWLEDLNSMLEQFRHREYDDDSQYGDNLLRGGFYKPATDIFLNEPTVS